MRHPTPQSERRLFYISRSLATPEQTEQILAGARRRNQQSGVTGALLFTGGHFAQILEGSEAALASTMTAVEADTRHEAVTRLLEGELDQRRFAGWDMAYLELPGADELIDRLLADGDIAPERAERILNLMFELAPR